MIKERHQNPVVNDTIRLRLFTFNSNNPQNILSIPEIDIYRIDKNTITDTNPDGLVLIQQFPAPAVVQDNTGSYYFDLPIPAPTYVIGNYADVWQTVFEAQTPANLVGNKFSIYPRLWFTDTLPIVYDFNFCFSPNRIVQGSKKYLVIEIIPTVPRVNELERYYENLAIAAQLSISIAKKCDPCLPQEQDLRTIIDNDPVVIREKVFGYYQLDTSTLDGGLYDVWFTLNLGGNTYVSERSQLQILC